MSMSTDLPSKIASLEEQVQPTDDLKVIDQIVKTDHITTQTNSQDLLITGSADNTIYIFDKITGHTRGYLKGHHAPVTHLEVFHDDSMLASVDEERNIKIWDLNNYHLVFTFRGHFDEITAITISCIKQNQFLHPINAVKSLIDKIPYFELLTGDVKGNIIKYNLNLVTQSIEKKFFEESHTDVITALTVDQNNELYSASKDNSLKKWNRNGELKFTKYFESAILNLKQDYVNNQLIAGSDDSQLIIFDVKDMKMKLHAHKGKISNQEIQEKTVDSKMQQIKKFKKFGVIGAFVYLQLRISKVLVL